MAFDFNDPGFGNSGVGLNPQTLLLGPAGAFLGKQMGLFGGRTKAPNYDDLIAQRQADINAFSAKLDASRNAILSNYQNLQSNTMKRFSGDFEAALAGRGISPAGGAFASGVGREATMLQGQYDAQNAEMTNQNLNTIGQMQMGLGQERLGLGMNQRMQNYQQTLQNQQAIGSLVGTGIGYAMGGPIGGMMGRNALSSGGTMMGQSVFGSGGSGLNLGMYNSMRNNIGGYGPSNDYSAFYRRLNGIG